MGIGMGLLGGIGQGVSSFMDSYERGQDRKFKREQEAQDRAMRQKMYDLGLAEKGFEETPEGKFQRTSDYTSKQEREIAEKDYEKQLKEREFGLKEKEYGRHAQEFASNQDYKQKEYGLKERELGLKGDYQAGLLGAQQSQQKIDQMYKSGLLNQGERNSEIEKTKMYLASLKPGANRGLGKQLPSDKVLLVNEGKNIPRLLEDLQGTLAAQKDKMGPIQGRLQSMNPYSEAGQTTDAQIRSSSQAFGKYMEGGVLRKEDEIKYQKMFPNMSDTPAVAQNKLQLVQRLLGQKLQADVGALEKSGYDVSGLKGDMPLAPDLPKVLGNGLVQKNHGLLQQSQADQSGVKQIGGKNYKKVQGGWEEVE